MSTPRSDLQIEMKQAGRTFSGRVAVAPLDLGIVQGEFVSILGPSGSGKSTLLRMIAGLESADTGTITVSSAAKAFVFQEASLLPWRSVLENVRLPLELIGIEKRAASERAREALVRVGLSSALDLHPNQLSGGMKMRVSVARALVVKPSLLLLDEPFAALDERTRFKLQEDLRTLWEKERMTAVFVTHSVSEAVFLSERAIVLSETPAKILIDHKVNLPFERGPALRTNEKFTDEVRKLSEYFA